MLSQNSNLEWILGHPIQGIPAHIGSRIDSSYTGPRTGMSPQPPPPLSFPVSTSLEHLVSPAGRPRQSAPVEALPQWPPLRPVWLGAHVQPVPVPALAHSALLSNVDGHFSWVGGTMATSDVAGDTCDKGSHSSEVPTLRGPGLWKDPKHGVGWEGRIWVKGRSLLSWVHSAGMAFRTGFILSAFIWIRHCTHSSSKMGTLFLDPRCLVMCPLHLVTAK